MEESIILEQSNRITVYSDIPYGLITDELDSSRATVFKSDFAEIKNNYRIYKHGTRFDTEGSNGDYIPNETSYRMVKTLINKEARFLFGVSPKITLTPVEASDENNDRLNVIENALTLVMNKSNFSGEILKAAKDCFIGKRIAVMANFNEEDGISINFIPSERFIYEESEYGNNTLTKFVSFTVITDSDGNNMYYKKKYFLNEYGDVILHETIVDSAGTLREEIFPETKIELNTIPVRIILNDGLLGDKLGVSEIEELKQFEKDFSKLANADMDAARKAMNPVKYAKDMDPDSTKDLSTGPGAFWDLATDTQNDNASSEVGMLEPQLSYSSPLNTTMNRIKTSAYEMIDMPNINLETMIGSITSGKALKAIYWGLDARCEEKMKAWEPALVDILYTIISGISIYPEAAESTGIDVSEYEVIDLDITVKGRSPIPEDELEQKEMDLQEVVGETMSKKTYMKKWRGLTEDEAQEELIQIAKEKQILEEARFTFEEE